MKRKRRKRLKIKTILLFLLLLILIPTSITLFFETNNKQNINKEKPIKEENSNKTYSISLVMVGDALIHNSLYNDAKKATNEYDFKPQIEFIKEEISNYDLAYYNQETILGGSQIGISSYPAFNTPQEFGDAMIDAGFNLVSLATNHTLDKGEKAVISSRAYWNQQENVHAIGSYTSYEEKENIESQIFTVNNITYAMLNYTYGTNGIKVPNNKDYLVNLWDDTNNYEGYKEQVKKDIENLRDKVDVLIVAMHWGREYTHQPTKLEKETANFLASLDVDIVIGTHPHVIQPIEYINNTLVFYSLGNFISAQTSSSCSNYKCNIGLMSSLTITKTIQDDVSQIEINNIKNNLIYTYHQNYTNFKVLPFSNPKIKNYLPNYIDIYNQYSDIIKTDDERIETVSIAS